MSLGQIRARAYWVTGPGEGDLRDAPLEGPAPDHSLVETLFTGVSVGTERLVGRGEVPPDCSRPMACRYMEGDLGLPVKYGYSLVGRGLEGELAGRSVFVMHPHQDRVVVADEHALVLPDSLPLRRATLIPNLETALNASWDAPAAAAPGTPVLVVGAGAVGLLVAYVLFRARSRPIPVVEIHEERARLAESLPWVEGVLAPGELARQFGDGLPLAFHASGTEAGLQCALDAVGFEGEVIDLSWYGKRALRLDLGAGFHYQRKTLRASQVSAIAPSRRATHDHRSRLQAVLELLGEPALDRLLGAPVPFAALPRTMHELYRGGPTPPLPLIAYPEP